MSKPNLDILDGPRQRVFAMLADGRAALANIEASQWRALALVRFGVMRALNDYVACKQEGILAPIIAASEGAISDLAAQLARTNADLLREYEDFAERWALRSPVSVDHAYKTEARAMATRIETMVTGEANEIARLVAAHRQRARQA